MRRLLSVALGCALGTASHAAPAHAAPPQRPLLAATATAPGPGSSKPDENKPEPVSVHAFAASVGLDATWLEAGKRLQLKSQWTEIILEADRREVLINGSRVFMGEGAVAGKKTLLISPIDRDRLLLPILAPQQLEARRPLKIIAIDAGHGGKDNGTRNEALKLLEKDFALDLAKRVKALLDAAGYTVMLTRTDDTFIALPDRPARAAAAGADLFVSLHFNATGNADVRGIETYILTPQFQRSTGADERRADDDVPAPGNAFDGWNSYLGYTIHKQLRADLKLPDRGLKRARFVVLRELKSPGLLVEGGYLSNSAEAKLIASPEYRAKLAASVVSGVEAYNQTLKRLEAVRGGQ